MMGSPPPRPGLRAAHRDGPGERVEEVESRPITTRLAGGRTLRPAVILAAAVIVPLLLFVVLVRWDSAQRDDQLTTNAAIATLLAREQVQRVIEGGLAGLDRIEDLSAGQSWAQLQQRRAQLQPEFRRIEQSKPAISHLALIRPDGRVVVSGSPEIAPLADASALEALRTLRDGQRSLAFDPPPRALFGEEAGLAVSRARAPEGRPFDGIALVVLRSEAFLGAWREAARSAGGRFALVREDGTILLREDAAADGAARLALDGALEAAYEAEPTASTPLTGDPFHDGALQYVAWRQVGGLPLRIVYTLPQRPEQRRATIAMAVIGMACALAAAMLALTALALRRRTERDRETLARLEENAADLRAEIARREVAEENLRNAQRLEGLGRLTGGVAHDFNNLLTAILGTVRALERHLGRQVDERTKRLLSAAAAAVDRGARLNASLLAFARRQPLVLATVDANALVQDFRPLLRRALDESIILEFALDQKLPPCRADAAQLEAALLNLAINARDAMPRGGKLRIVTRRAWLQEQALAGNPDAQPGPYVAVEVRDTGEGMSPEVRERAFEPFFTTKKAGEGTGLGLSQVFGFMRQIGGHVAIQSTPGRGTTVTLYLPLGSEVEAPAARPAAPARLPGSGQGTSVLVVEDEPAVRAVAVDMLTDYGFTVLAAPDGPTALQLLREGVQADILFSDVVMPGGMTGVDLAREARRLRPRIGVLLASGYAAEALAKHGGAGEFELISKPYDVETVIARIAALRRRHVAA